MKREAISFKAILRNNLIITTTAIIMLGVILPYVLEQFAPKLWEYVVNNITIESVEDTTSGGDPLMEAIGGLIGSISAAAQLFVIRGFRFLYLLVISIMLLYLLIYFILSLIMNNKVGGKAILVSVVISSLIAFGITYIIMINSKEVMVLLVDYVENMENVAEYYQFENTTAIIDFAVDLFYGIYYGFALLFIFNFIVVSIFQNLLKN